jgi:hypothetical protein
LMPREDATQIDRVRQPGARSFLGLLARRRHRVRVSITIAVDDGPPGLAVTPDGGKVYVTIFVSNNISVIDTPTTFRRGGAGQQRATTVHRGPMAASVASPFRQPVENIGNRCRLCKSCQPEVLKSCFQRALGRE